MTANSPPRRRRGPLPHPIEASKPEVCFVRNTSTRDVASAQLPVIWRRRGERVIDPKAIFKKRRASAPC